MQVEFYGRAGLPASDEAKGILERVRAQIPFDLIEVDIEQDDRLRKQFGDEVPVIYVDGRKAFRNKLDEALLVRKLERGRSFAMGTLDPRANLTRGRPVTRGTKLIFGVVACLAVAGVFTYTAVRKLIVEPGLELRALEITPVHFDAPAFRLADSHGEAKALADYRGKVVFLNFWASWCAPCREEMPDMARLAMALGDRKDFAMVAVSVDDGWDPIHRYFKDQFGSVPPPFVVLLDQGAKVSHAYGTTQFPETYVINRQGQAVAKFVGARDWGDPAAIHYLERLLN